MKSKCPRRVLIVDQSRDSREVLRWVLERRGLEILEAASADLGLELLRDQQPQVTVIDLDGVPADQEGLPAEYGRCAERQHAGLVLLATLRRPTTPAGGQLVNKPYHYQTLVRTIEQLLDHPPGH